jgi:hypothetical protein
VGGLIILTMLAAVLFQGYLWIDSSVIPQIHQINQLSGKSMKYRAAYRALGEANAEYLEFLDRTIPQNARVLIPPTFPQHPLAHVGAMQFFLFPRDIHNCGSDEIDACIMRMKDSDFYVIVVGGFPPRDLILQVRKFIPFRGDLGVYGPED